MGFGNVELIGRQQIGRKFNFFKILLHFDVLSNQFCYWLIQQMDKVNST